MAALDDFKAHLEAEVRISPAALEALAEKGSPYARYRDDAPASAATVAAKD